MGNCSWSSYQLIGILNPPTTKVGTKLCSCISCNTGQYCMLRTALIGNVKNFCVILIFYDASIRLNGVHIYLQNLKNRQGKLLVSLQATKSTQLSQFMFILLGKFEVNLPNTNKQGKQICCLQLIVRNKNEINFGFFKIERQESTELFTNREGINC